MANRFSLPVRHCPELDVLAAFLGFAFLFFPVPRTDIAGVFLLAAALVWFVAQWIHEDQPLSDGEIEALHHFLVKHPELHLLYAEFAPERPWTYRRGREIEYTWRLLESAR
ncbi:MAG: hypothetical protein RE468_04840 [Acidithiobacillus caldus]|uniref:hypothetical protein n=1 Tax=Acidithiobacillus caldus TaxID=33059 RepID=UPI002815396F|nr:hypothetical protein [Acidithiobacillus caldus]WMT47939.1 MAG: hypothetical protein RE468_04840 [Acidithiobacillus caldus]